MSDLAASTVLKLQELHPSHQQQFLDDVVRDYQIGRSTIGPASSLDMALARLVARRYVETGDVLAVVDRWPAARTTLDATVGCPLQAEALYNDAPEAYLRSYPDNEGIYSELEAALPDGVDNPNDYIVAAKVKAIDASLLDAITAIDEQSALVSSIAAHRIELGEHHLYGSSRLGVKQYASGVSSLYRDWRFNGSPTSVALTADKPWWWRSVSAMQGWGSQVSSLSTNHYTGYFTVGRTIGQKRYELSDRLGNVLITARDRKRWNGSLFSGVGAWEAEAATVSDVYPYGMPIAERTQSNSPAGTPEYRFGFNGQKKVDEVAGTGNHNTVAFWEYDIRKARRWNIDLIIKIGQNYYSVIGKSPIMEA